MKIDALIEELQLFKEKYGNVDVVYWYEDKERTLSISDLMPVNTGTAVTPNWKCELTD
jgi:hypothetical protein